MTKPEIELSDLYLHLTVETGTSLDGSFIIYSKNGQELSGKVLSTNDKIVVTMGELSGTECEIPFYFKAKMAIPGEEHFGDFLLITNGGEWNIPYCISVVPKKLRVCGYTISNFSEFRDFAKTNWEKAREVFFTKEFHDVFFENNDEYHELYHSLLKGQSKDVILDNFLMEVTGKEKAEVFVEIDEMTVWRGTSQSIQLGLQGWGHLEGRIYSKYGGLHLEKDSFHIADFENDKMEFMVSFKEGCYSDTLILETVYQKLEIKIKEQVESVQRTLARNKKKKEAFPVLLRKYVELRTGVIGVEEYVNQSLEILPEAGNFYELYRFQLSIISGQTSKQGEYLPAEAMAKEIEEKRTVYLNDSSCRSYYYYLMSLCKKDRASLMEAAIQIKDQYEKSRDYYDYLLLLMVDKNYALNFRGQCEQLSDYLKSGTKSPLVYLSLLDVLNREPYYLENLVGIRSELMNWGLKHGYLSLELTRQFATIALKEKYFSKRHLLVLLKLYELKQDEVYLKAICSLFIKGNKTEHSCHAYFEDALAKELKIVGLNEYYLRTLDFNEYPVLPKPILYYFHYSNSLDKREKAYLYSNILQNKESYKDILPNYMIRIEQFVHEQMIEGRMNRYLFRLYEQLLPEILKNKDMMKYLPNIIFKKKLICPNPVMEGVYVKHDGQEEVYYPIVDGEAQIEIFSDHAQLYFTDHKANRYHWGIEYKILPYLKEDNYRDMCIQYNSKNNKVVCKWIEHSVKDLKVYLEQVDYQTVNPIYRRALMNHYMTSDRMEDAYFGAELYGSDWMDVSQLYLLTCVGLYLHREEKDDLLLIMAHRSFVGGRYNKEILLYLRDHFEGRNFDKMALWKVLKKEKLDTAEYEEQLLNQMLFTGDRDEGIFDVLLSYLEKRENDDLTVSLLEIYSIYYFIGRKNVPENYFAILEKQAEKGLSFISQLSYLLRKAHKGYRLHEKEYIKDMMEGLCKKHIVFDFYEKFESFVHISPLLKELTAFYCYGEEQMDARLNLVIENDNGQSRRLDAPMEEICPGFYYGKVYLLPNETVKEKGLFHKTEEIDCLIMTSKMNRFVNGSRADILYRMEEQKLQAGNGMEQYDTILDRMREQLKMLT